MDTLLAKILPEEKKSVREKCTDYVTSHPRQVAKGAAVGAIIIYTAPVILGAISWLPYIGAGYYLYTNTRTGRQWYEWGRSWL